MFKVESLEKEIIKRIMLCHEIIFGFYVFIQVALNDCMFVKELSGEVTIHFMFMFSAFSVGRVKKRHLGRSCRWSDQKLIFGVKLERDSTLVFGTKGLIGYRRLLV